jgi:deazaflavin-dependent oxidoreductase (nitroreductase family)
MGNSGRTIPGRSGSDRATARRRAFFGPLTRLINPRAVRLAGTARLPLFGVVRQRGRRSGRLYATPLAVRGFPGGFLIPLTFGPEADWCRNVLAAGECVIQWRGRQWTAVEPRVVDAADVGAELRVAMGRVERFMLRLMGTRQFLRLRDKSELRHRARRAGGPSGPVNHEE